MSGTYPTQREREQACVIADLKDQSKLDAWRIAELEAENKALQKQVANMPVVVGYVGKLAEKFLHLGNNMCDVTILHDAGERQCIPIYLDPPQE